MFYYALESYTPGLLFVPKLLRPTFWPCRLPRPNADNTIRLEYTTALPHRNKSMALPYRNKSMALPHRKKSMAIILYDKHGYYTVQECKYGYYTVQYKTPQRRQEEEATGYSLLQQITAPFNPGLYVLHGGQASCRVGFFEFAESKVSGFFLKIASQHVSALNGHFTVRHKEY